MARKTAAEIAKRDRDALELRRAGIPVATIREQLNFTTDRTVEQAIAKAMQAESDPNDVRKLELDRLDRLQAGVWAKAVKGDVAAVDRVIRLSELRMKLAGIPDDKMVMRRAYDKTVKALGLGDIDGAAVAAGRRIAEQIDQATATGDGMQVTKALYLIPHLMNVLEKLGATPAARDALAEVGEESAAKVEPAENDLAAFKRRNGIA